MKIGRSITQNHSALDMHIQLVGTLTQSILCHFYWTGYLAQHQHCRPCSSSPLDAEDNYNL